MELSVAQLGVEDALKVLRSPETMDNPVVLSEQMYRLGQYTAGVEMHLANLEREYEANEGEIYRAAMDTGSSATAAEKQVKIDLGAAEGEIKFLSRLVATAWKVQMTAMARHKHLTNESRV